MVIWVILIILLVVFMVALLGYARVTVQRRTSAEGIEDPSAAQAYNRISQWPQFKLLRRMIVGEIRKYHPEGIIVDVGCGPGYLVAVIAKSFPHLHIIGVDIADEMVQLASKNLSSLGFGEQVEFRQGDVQALPFDNNAVDFVVSTFSLHHWSEPSASMKEIYRVLKPGGQFLIFDLRRDARRFFYWLLGFAQTFVVPAPIRSVNEPTGSARSSYTPVEAEAFLSDIPLQQYRIKPGTAWMFIWGQKD